MPMPRPRCPQRRKLPALLLGGLLAAAALLPATASAQAVSDPTPLQYRDAAEEARFHALAAELRCVQCQNQSLADSNAQIAHDLRLQVLALMREGKTDREIKDYLVARYSDFVLYNPPVRPSTWLLWFGPALILLGGAAVLVAVVRRRADRIGAGDVIVIGSYIDDRANFYLPVPLDGTTRKRVNGNDGKTVFTTNSTGRVTSKVVPTFTSEETLMLPPMASTIDLITLKPSPVPPNFRNVEESP